jgi:hypothetical protein
LEVKQINGEFFSIFNPCPQAFFLDWLFDLFPVLIVLRQAGNSPVAWQKKKPPFGGLFF